MDRVSERCLRILVVVCAALLVSSGFPGAASASQLIARNASNVKLKVTGDGVALVDFVSGGKQWHVLARGAVDALAPRKGGTQVKFQLDYGGGKKFFGKTVWKAFSNACRPYNDPALYAVVAACRAPDGSYWALQSWEQPLPNLGFLPWLPAQRDVWLSLSHWTGELPRLNVFQGWLRNHKYNALFGTFTYRGSPIYGFGTTRFGVPTDDWGRLIYLDTFGASAYGSGWRRENSFVSHNPSGAFCYAFQPRDPFAPGYGAPSDWERGAMRGPGVGSRYRLIGAGPGVTPLVVWKGDALARKFAPLNPADVLHDLRTSRAVAELGSRLCVTAIARPNRRGLSNLRDDFSGELGEWWQPPAVTGGATAGVVGDELIFSLPGGGASSAELVTKAKMWDPKSSPAFFDLGATGVTGGATFQFLLYPNVGFGRHAGDAYNGVRITNGEIQAVRRYWRLQSWPEPAIPANTIEARAPYDPARMRWLYVWMQKKKLDIYYAPTGTGPWTKLGGTDASDWGLATAQVKLIASSGGEAGRVTVVSLSE